MKCISGASGVNGGSGTSGTTGANGSSGSSGVSSSSGLSGYSPYYSIGGFSICPTCGSNSIGGQYDSLWGGIYNCIYGNCDTIGGGSENCISFSLYGREFISPADRNFIGAGFINCICSDIVASGGEEPYCMDAQINVIGGGYQNAILGSIKRAENACQVYYDVIGGGQHNVIGCVKYSGILGNCNNTIQSATNTFIFRSFLGTSTSNTSYFCAIAKTFSTFRIHHPDPEKSATHYLFHTNVESPTEGDNIYRYEVETKNGKAEINLPSYYKWLNKNDQVWVSPKQNFGNAYGVINAEQTKVEIYSDVDSEFYVLLIGTRKDEDGVKFWKGAERIE